MTLSSRRSRLRLPAVWLTAPILFALWVGLLGRFVLDRVFRADAVAELPPYSVYFNEDNFQADRGHYQEPALDPVLTLLADETLSIILRPSAPIRVPVTLRAFRGRGGELRRWGAPFEPLNGGGFVLRAPLSALPELASGQWNLVFLVGEPRSLPPNPHEVPVGPGGLGWQVLRLRLNIAAESVPQQFIHAPVKSSRAASYGETLGPYRSMTASSNCRGGNTMPAEPFQLSRTHSAACLQIIRVWASQLAPGAEQDEIVAALGTLAVAMRVPEKIDPGARSAPELDGEDTLQKHADRRESGARTAAVDPDGVRSVAKSSEKLVPGARSATAKRDGEHLAGKSTEKLVAGSRSA